MTYPDAAHLGGITKWVTGFNIIESQNCYILNFGWSEELSFPQLATNVEGDNMFDAEFLR